MKWIEPSLRQRAGTRDLRNAIDAVRIAADQPPFWQGAPPPGGGVMAARINELFGPFNEARGAPVFALGPFGYSGGIVAPATGVRIVAGHLQEVRDALR